MQIFGSLAVRHSAALFIYFYLRPELQNVLTYICINILTYSNTFYSGKALEVLKFLQ